MAGGVGYHYGKLIADFLLGSGTPATWYAALFTAAPTDAGGGTEVTGGSYARVAVTNNATSFPGAATGPVESDSGVLIDWGTATAGWGTIVAVGLFDASSGGNLGPWLMLSVATLINSGSSFKITSGNLKVTVS